MSNLTLTFHGGLCCGIKTIHGFPYDGEQNGEPCKKREPALRKLNKRNNDQWAGITSQRFRFFSDYAPKETTEERLDRYLTFLRKERPKGIVEAVLITKSGCSYFNQSKMIPVLEKRGFKAVTTAKNSNSGNEVTVFHLIME